MKTKKKLMATLELPKKLTSPFGGLPNGFARIVISIARVLTTHCSGILGIGNVNVARNVLPSSVVRAPVSQK